MFEDDKIIKLPFDINANKKELVILDSEIYTQDIESVLFEYEFDKDKRRFDLDKVYTTFHFEKTDSIIDVDADRIGNSYFTRFEHKWISRKERVYAHVRGVKGDKSYDIAKYRFDVDVSMIDRQLDEIQIIYSKSFEELLDEMRNDFSDFLNGLTGQFESDAKITDEDVKNGIHDLVFTPTQISKNTLSKIQKLKRGF